MELYPDALTYFDKVLSIMPNHFMCLYSKGVTYYLIAKQKIEDQEKHPHTPYTHSLEEDDKLRQFQEKMEAAIKVLVQEAIVFLSKSLEVQPNNELAFLYRALAAQYLKDDNKARQDILTALKLRPDLAKRPEAQGLIRKYLME